MSELPTFLSEDEVIEKVLSDIYNDGDGLLIATKLRLVSVRNGLLSGAKVEDYPYAKIITINTWGHANGAGYCVRAGRAGAINLRLDARDFSDFKGLAFQVDERLVDQVAARQLAGGRHVAAAGS